MESVRHIMPTSLGNSTMIEEIKKRVALIQTKQTTQSTSQSFNCIKCEDKGFTLDEEEAVIWCECRKKKETLERLEKSGLKMRFDSNRISNYKMDSKQRAEAVKICKDYVEKFDKTKTLVLSGQVGAGKTHLAIASSRILLEKYNVKYVDFVNEISRLKFNQIDQDAYSNIVDACKYATVLFIDDLYKGDTSEATQRIVQDIINYRYNNNKSMIITTELTKDMLINLNEATASRLIEMTYDGEGDYFVEFSGKQLNYRLYR